MGSLIGEEIDNYRFLELIGQGGMGVVYKALHVPLNRVVAIKMVHPLFTEDKAFIRRFQKEAQALAKLDHKHIVTVLDFRESQHGWMIVMGYVQGATLADKITDEGALQIGTALDIIKQILNGIGYAHSRGTIHRDIKPRNIMISSDGTVKLTDFGLVKADRSASSQPTLLELTSSTTTTKGGTIYYMSPEQIRTPSQVDHRTDLYSVGVTFYEMLTGRRPFEDSDSDYEIQSMIIHNKFPPPQQFNPNVPRELSKIVMKAIHKNRDQRFQSAEEMLAAIEQFEGTLEPEIPVKSPSSEAVLANKTPKEIKFPKSRPTSFADTVSRFFTTQWAFLKARKPRIETTFAPRHLKNLKIVVFSILAVAGITGILLLLKLLSHKPAPENKGEISIMVIPGNANVLIDDSPTDSAQLANLKLDPGWHRIFISLDGFISRDDSFEVVKGLNPSREFTLEPSASPGVKTGQLEIASDPSGARVYMDNRYLGKTPLTIDAEIGRRRVGLRKEGYEDFRKNVVIKEGQTTDLGTIPLTPLSIVEGIDKSKGSEVEKKITGLNEKPASPEGKLAMSVLPTGMIFIDNQAQKMEPNNQYLLTLPAGSHKVTVQHPNWGMWEKKVEIKGGETINILVDFNEEVELIVYPEGAIKGGEVFVDNQFAGYARNKIKVRVGLREVDVRREGFKSDGPKRINFENGKNESIEFWMEKRQ